MPLDIVIGAQWGDEGKGRFVDLLSTNADFVARYNGGDNAGHTVTVGTQTFKLHLIPSGIIHPHPTGIIGNGIVINPAALLSEIDELSTAGINASPDRLHISYAAHLITPGHLALDAAQESPRGRGAIGTTLRGIGPAYTDKVARSGLRAGQMMDLDQFAAHFDDHIHSVNQRLTGLYSAEPLDLVSTKYQYLDYARRLKPYIRDVSLELSEALKNGQRVLAEGAQGTLLDLDHGTYPYVTSSSPTAAGALLGLGLGVGSVERVVGVAKAFQSRVGAGPFPSEVFGDTALSLRGTGEQPWDEFGTTTGRPRRVGWLDIVLLRYALRVNGITELAITKLDILSGLEQIKLCTGYSSAGQEVIDLPFGPAEIAEYSPVHELLPSWQADLRGCRNWEDLPGAARRFILRIEELCEVPVRLISVGPEREQYIEVF